MTTSMTLLYTGTIQRLTSQQLRCLLPSSLAVGEYQLVVSSSAGVTSNPLDFHVFPALVPSSISPKGGNIRGGSWITLTINTSTTANISSSSSIADRSSITTVQLSSPLFCMFVFGNVNNNHNNSSGYITAMAAHFVSQSSARCQTPATTADTEGGSVTVTVGLSYNTGDASGLPPLLSYPVLPVFTYLSTYQVWWVQPGVLSPSNVVVTSTSTVSSASITSSTNTSTVSSVLLHGYGFVQEHWSSGAATCRLGGLQGLPATPLMYLSPSEVSCVVPKGLYDYSTLGWESEIVWGDLSIEISSDGLDYSDTGVSITVLRTPRISTVSPALGPLAGGTAVTITGDYFDQRLNLTCIFQGLDIVPAIIISSTQISCPSPLVPTSFAPMLTLGNNVTSGTSSSNGGSTVVISLAVGDGKIPLTSGNYFQYYQQPTVLAMSPVYAPFGQSPDAAMITLQGVNFFSSVGQFCEWTSLVQNSGTGSLQSSGTVYSTPLIVMQSDMVLCTPPPSPLVSVFSLALAWNGVASDALPLDSSKYNFTTIRPPVDMVMPTIFAMYTSPRMLTMTGRFPVDDVLFGDATSLRCVFNAVVENSYGSMSLGNGTMETLVVLMNATTVQCYSPVVPVSLRTGRPMYFDVQLALGFYTFPDATTNNTTATSTSTFRLVIEPDITVAQLIPYGGACTGGNVLTITGGAFQSRTSSGVLPTYVCEIGGYVSPATVVSSNEIQCGSPMICNATPMSNPSSLTSIAVNVLAYDGHDYYQHTQVPSLTYLAWTPSVINYASPAFVTVGLDIYVTLYGNFQVAHATARCVIYSNSTPRLISPPLLLFAGESNPQI